MEQRKSAEQSSNSTNRGTLPSRLSGTTWRLHDSNGNFLLGVSFIDNDYLRFEMYGFDSGKCEYGISPSPNSDVNLITFRYRGMNMKLYYKNSNYSLLTSEGYSLKLDSE